MLTEKPLQDNPWELRGYESLVIIKEELDVDIYLKENIYSEEDIQRAVDELASTGVKLIFGHGNLYGRYFVELADDYPEVHFVYFNGGYYAENVTSLNFHSHAMGFFSGMIAGEMTETMEIGILAAHEWQQEVEGFYEGVKYQAPEVTVHINFIQDWNELDTALQIYDDMLDKDVDVVYPAGDIFNEIVLKRAIHDDIYGIGYGMNQSHLDSSAILTSTIQHVDSLYVFAAEQVEKQSLDGDILSFDFQDGMISLGPYSPEVPKVLQEEINDYIDTYKLTGLLPHEQE